MTYTRRGGKTAAQAFYDALLIAQKWARISAARAEAAGYEQFYDELSTIHAELSQLYMRYSEATAAGREAHALARREAARIDRAYGASS